ncbi:hypothetical protein [Aliirhizobium smilacinae]|uniref:Uncharacterized protein n=1 Tax=Aliirhizobium smilacinae TaxID=1395944 RepID=A0A5C4XAA1_9HYPH|nr:hypothetical protein [Rhizobium smilacinae]TNM60328.1 hypothetical protein FHP24_26400 [Rhizobium smilacinae]
MSRERTAAGNILALSPATAERAEVVEEAATSYMPTSIDLEAWLPDTGGLDEDQTDTENRRLPVITNDDRRGRNEMSTLKGSTEAGGHGAGRKRVSLYLDDEILTKVFRVSLEKHEQLSSATHRLIREALEARGL